MNHNDATARLNAQAQSVLENAAFKSCMANLREDALEGLLTAKPDAPFELQMARVRYDATLMIEYELERMLRSYGEPRG